MVGGGGHEDGIALAITDFISLMRPKQWLKGAFVLIGPVYGMALSSDVVRWNVAAAFVAFGLASSGCYIVNDIRDAAMDRLHPRKRNRPIASGRIQPGAAMALAVVLWVVAAALVYFGVRPVGTGLSRLAEPRLWVGICVGAYVANVLAYSMFLKNMVVADTISLALGFVLRVLGGCAAAAVEPSAWLLNVTFFLSMFLALGKRLGERKTMGDSAAAVRGVQAKYTDNLLQMAAVVTGVATLVSYSDYVQAQSQKYTLGFNLLWLTMIPATYGLLRCLVLLERGAYDDPTELASRDRPFQIAGAVFGLITVALLMGLGRGALPGG